jgi:hypothetical protein
MRKSSFTPNIRPTTRFGRDKSTAGRLRERTIAIKKFNEDSQMEKITFKEILPYLLIWVGRIMNFLWCYTYHDI